MSNTEQNTEECLFLVEVAAMAYSGKSMFRNRVTPFKVKKKTPKTMNVVCYEEGSHHFHTSRTIKSTQINQVTRNVDVNHVELSFTCWCEESDIQATQKNILSHIDKDVKTIEVSLDILKSSVNTLKQSI